MEGFSLSQAHSTGWNRRSLIFFRPYPRQEHRGPVLPPPQRLPRIRPKRWWMFGPSFLIMSVEKWAFYMGGPPANSVAKLRLGLLSARWEMINFTSPWVRLTRIRADAFRGSKAILDTRY